MSSIGIDVPDFASNAVGIGPPLVSETAIGNGTVRGPKPVNSWPFIALALQTFAQDASVEFDWQDPTLGMTMLETVHVGHGEFVMLRRAPIFPQLSLTYSVQGGGTVNSYVVPVLSGNPRPLPGEGYALLKIAPSIAAGVTDTERIHWHNGAAHILMTEPALAADVTIKAKTLTGSLIADLYHWSLTAGQILDEVISLPPYICEIAITNNGAIAGVFPSSIVAQLGNLL